jgi:hypothetical protein
MDKLINLKDYQNARLSLKSHQLGFFQNAEQQLRSIAIGLLEAFVTLEPTEKQIVQLEAHLKAYFAKQAQQASVTHKKV